MCCCCRQIPLPLPSRRLRAPLLRGTSFSWAHEELQSSEWGPTAPRQRPRKGRARKTPAPSPCIPRCSRRALSIPGPQRWVGVWRQHPATRADVTVNHSIPRPSPPPKLYLREGKNNSWQGKSWNEPKDSSSTSQTRTNQGDTPLPATWGRGHGLPPVVEAGGTLLSAGATMLVAVTTPVTFTPAQVSALGQEVVTGARAVLILTAPFGCWEPALAPSTSCLSQARQVNGPS